MLSASLQCGRGSIKLLLGLILALAFGLRVAGIGNGLPYAQLSEESADIATGLRIASGDMPTYAYHRVGWPITQLVIHGARFVSLRLQDPNFDTDDFRALYFTDRASFIYPIRFLQAVLGTFAVLVVYVAGHWITETTIGGVFSALALAVHPAHVYLSHVALPDSYALLSIATTLLATIAIMRTGARWAYVLAGAAYAITLLARLQALSVGFPIVLAHLLYWWQLPNRPRRVLVIRWLWALVPFLITSMLLNPFILSAPDAIISDIEFIFAKRYVGDAAATFDLNRITGNLAFPLTMSRPYMATVAAVGAVVTLLRRDTRSFLILTFGALFPASILPSFNPDITFFLPIVVPTVLLIGYTVGIMRKRGNRAAFVVLFAASSVAVTFGLFESLMIDRALIHKNTRMAAYEFITKHIPPNSNVLIGDTFTYSVPLQRSNSSITRLESLTLLPPSYQFQLEHPETAIYPQYNVFGPEYQARLYDDESWWQFVLARQIQYVIETDFCSGDNRYQSGSVIEFPVVSPIVRAKLEPIYTISPFADETCRHFIDFRLPLRDMDPAVWHRIGPIIRVYRVPETAGPVASPGD